MYGNHTNINLTLYKEEFIMRNPQQLERLMEYDQPKRIFILEALNVVEKAIERHIYNYDGAYGRNILELKLSDIFYQVFAYDGTNDDERIVIDWRNGIIERNCYSAIPEEIYLTCWKEQFKKIKSNPHEKTIIVDWFYGLRDELNAQGFNVHELFCFESEKIVIEWS